MCLVKAGLWARACTWQDSGPGTPLSEGSESLLLGSGDTQCLEHGRQWVPMTKGWMIRISRLQLLELRTQNSFIVVRGSIVDPAAFPRSVYPQAHITACQSLRLV